jgi:hypothetical protein
MVPFTSPVRRGVSKASLKYHPGPPCSTLLRPAGGRPPKRPYGRFGGGPPAGRVACAVLYPLGYPMPYGPAPHLTRLWRLFGFPSSARSPHQIRCRPLTPKSLFSESLVNIEVTAVGFRDLLELAATESYHIRR